MINSKIKKACIFNIQKFSVNDGPGIRTTVFLKGCPLRCLWCANPESQLKAPQLMWDREKCCRCRACERACGDGSVSFEGDEMVLRPDRCSDPSASTVVCPTGALTSEGEWKTVDEVFDECMKDLPFYEESGGGVTLSGGEALLWPDFCVELLGKLRENGINTAIETTGFVSEEVFLKVAPFIDFFLFDMKHYDREKHIEGTGVPNDVILSNMKRAIEMGMNVLPRIPVIPGYNDSLEDAEGFADLLRSVGAERAQLLPFHQFGEKKYSFLTRPYTYGGVKGLTKEDLSLFLARMREKGTDAFF